jgi:Flp pilus assembly pilin Flp
MIEMWLDAIKSKIRNIRENEDGATMIQYALLIMILTVALISLIAAVGGWVGTTWESLKSSLS